MCERTKKEILARELCIQYWGGMCHESGQPRNTNFISVMEYTEAHYKNFIPEATNVLETLAKHSD